MLLTVAFLAIYCAYAFLIGSIEKSWVLMTAGVVAVIATYGVAMLRPWSRHLVYVLTAGFLAKLALSIYDGVASGFFRLQLGTPGAIVRSMVPTVLMATLSGACCVFVYRHFLGTRSGRADG
jgi:hypothetical protein